MARVKRSYAFWTALLAVVLLPAVLLANKQLYKAEPTNSAGTQVGSAIITVRVTGYDYMARTFSLPGNQVNGVFLTPVGGGWQIQLCAAGGAPEDDCLYDGTGNLDIDGAITPSMLLGAGVSGATFSNALKNNQLQINYNNNGTTLASGIFTRLI